MIDEFIAAEMEYFRPMMMRQTQCSSSDRQKWRIETVFERRRRISLEVYEAFGGVVRYGLFSGLQLTKTPWWGIDDLGSQCVGLYEKEVIDAIENQASDGKHVFIDIGAADGYYGVGLLHSGTFRKSICFEMEEKGRNAIKSNWKRNGCPGELDIFGKADAQQICSLPEAITSDALCLIDVEGYEFDLLTFEVLRHLSSATIILEVHNWVVDFELRYSELLVRASQFFEISIIEPVARDTTVIPELRDFTDDNRGLLVSERRPCLMRFLMLTPRLKS